MRIVYCLDSINRIGGIQRVTVEKANALAAIDGNEVWIVLADNSGKRIYEVSLSVHVIDLAVNYYDDDWKSRFHVLKGLLVKRGIHKRRLASELREICPDVVISVGESEKNILPSIKGKWITIREIHFTKHYRWLNAKSLFDKVMAWGGEFRDYGLSIKHYDRIVVLTYEDRETNWSGFKRVSVIPNPVSFKSEKASVLDRNRVLAVGRLTAQKNFSSLIRAFGKVASAHPGWCLDIIGEGGERNLLEDLIKKLSLEDRVFLRGESENVQDEMMGSSILAMSSRFEGFGLVIIEAMSVGLPVVAYSCPCGPKDIISDGVDGFLVPPEDEDFFAKRLSELIENESLRRNMGAAAFQKAGNYGAERISALWMDLFAELLAEKQR